MDKKDFENIFNQLIENFDKFFSSKPVKKLSKEEKIDTIKDLQIYLVLFYRNLQNTIGDEKKLNKIIIDNNLQPIRDISNKFLQTAMSGGSDGSADNTKNVNDDFADLMSAFDEVTEAAKPLSVKNEADNSIKAITDKVEEEKVLNQVKRQILK